MGKEERKNEIVNSMEVLREVSGMLGKIEEKLDRNIDGMDAAIAALIGISIHGFVASSTKIIKRRLEKDEMFHQAMAKHAAEAENSGLSMN